MQSSASSLNTAPSISWSQTSTKSSAPPWGSILSTSNLFMGKEEGTIILAFLHLIHFWKRFIDNIFFIFLVSHTQLETLMTFIDTVSQTIKVKLSYSKQTVSLLEGQVYLSESRKFKKKLYKKPIDYMALLHFHSYHPHSCKERIIYPKALGYNMIISEDHILQEELDNLTRSMVARAYLLHLIINNIKKALISTRNLLSQGAPRAKRNILPIITN